MMRLFSFVLGLSVCAGVSALVPKQLLQTPMAARPAARRAQSRGMVLHASLAKSVVGGAALFAASKALKVVQQGDISLVERFGKFHKTLEPGLHTLIPFVDRVRATVTTREQVLDIPPQKCITSDNAPLAADAVVYWRVINPEKTIYAVVDLELAIQNLVLTELRAEIGKLTLDMTFSAREQINAVLLEDLDIATDPWGVKITRVEVRDIMPNQQILKAMEMQMAAEREKRADIIKSEGARERSINVAEGEARSRLIDAEASAKAVILEADAEANRLEAEAQGVSKALSAIASSLGGDVEAAARFQLLREHIAAQRDLASSENAKVIVASPGSSGAAEDLLAKSMAFYQVSS